MNSSCDNRKVISKAFNDILQEGKIVEIPVYGLSMFPLFLPGDIVRVVNKEVLELINGDVVVFKVGSKLIMHRLLSININAKQLLCKGDGLILKDPAINFENYLGVVIEHYRKGKSLKSSRIINFLILKSTNFLGVIFYILGRFWNKLYNRRIM